MWTNLHKEPRFSERNETNTPTQCFHTFFFIRNRHYIAPWEPRATEAEASANTAIPIFCIFWNVLSYVSLSLS